MTRRLLVIAAGFDTSASERVLQKEVVWSHCCQGGSRTRGSRIISPLLYPLSYLYAQDGIRTRASGLVVLRSTSELPVRAVTDPSLEPVHGTHCTNEVSCAAGPDWLSPEIKSPFSLATEGALIEIRSV